MFSEGIEGRARLVLSVLFLLRFISGTPSIIIGLLLIEIGQTFSTPIGMTGQIGTFYSILGIITAIVLGAVSVRFNHKSLLLTGFLTFLASAIGCGFAPSFLLMIIFYSLSGLSVSIIAPMTTTLVANYFPPDFRPNAIGWLIAGASSSYILGAQLITRIAGIGGWRAAFLWLILPLNIFGLLAAKTTLPDIKKPDIPSSKTSYIKGFTAILRNRSAFFCLVGTALRNMSFQVILLYGTSMLREQFDLQRGLASIIMTAAALFYTIGSLFAGKFTTKYGRKNITLISVLIASVTAIIFTLSYNIWMALLMDFISAWFFGMSTSSGQSLNLEQVEAYRGTMMSLTSALASAGAAIGAALGGLMILKYGYRFLGISLGMFGIASSIVFLTLTVDPTRLIDVRSIKRS